MLNHFLFQVVTMSNCPTFYVNDPSLYPEFLASTKGFKFCEWKDFVREKVFGNFHLIAFAYLFSVFAIREWMKNRKAYDLRFPLFIWNLLLTLFSGFISYLGVVEFTYVLKREGLQGTICNHEMRDGVLGNYHVLLS